MNGQRQLSIFTDSSAFEALARDNGFRHWYESDLQIALGYSSDDTFHKVVNKATGVLMTTGIPVADNIVEVVREDGKRDNKLSRFACYIVAMNADVKKPEVAQAQTYFAALADSFQKMIDQADNIERVMIRDKVSHEEKSLSGVAHRAGVTNYAFFQNAGYRGLYNMNISQLKSVKKLPDGGMLLDYMGKEELAANLFRITQTESKIHRESIKGQSKLESAAEEVGKTVRKTIQQMGGTAPEQLPLAQDLKAVRKNLKGVHRDFQKLDKPTNKKKPKA
jgi:DNA-damage-inducible protein D